MPMFTEIAYKGIIIQKRTMETKNEEYKVFIDFLNGYNDAFYDGWGMLLDIVLALNCIYLK